MIYALIFLHHSVNLDHEFIEVLYKDISVYEDLFLFDGHYKVLVL